MKPSPKSYKRLGITQSKAKMYEYHIDEKHHIGIQDHPRELFPFAIGILGDIASAKLENAEDLDEDQIVENLSFSARFFDSYIRARFDKGLNNELLLLGACAYYLGNLQGSSYVLFNHIKPESLKDSPLKMYLYQLLAGNKVFLPEVFNALSSSLLEASEKWFQFLQTGTSYDDVIGLLLKVRDLIYSRVDSVDIFFIDIIIAITERKHKNSLWVSLPEYSGLSQEIWRPIITKQGFVRELWPAQHMLGKQDVFKGKSAVVQMPTSAGKTKSSELIIRSSFLSERSDIALIVAPFRALCHEIRNDLIKAFEGEDVEIAEISDVLQKDIDIFQLLGGGGAHKKVLVLTPEKLLYILRQEEGLVDDIGLVIFDEGHQFDSGTRGITYELLLTSLKGMLPVEAQKVLISAVISNASEIGKWLNGEESEVVKGSNISPTYKTLGFASWIDTLGKIKFVNSTNIDEEDFFVPRVMSRDVLTKVGRERVSRYFPSKDDGKSVALYLGLKLVSNGGVAIFCGNKDTPNTIAEKLIDLEARKYNQDYPYKFSNTEELQRLNNLIALNLGQNSLPCKAARLGLFMHHARTPQGMRVAIEAGMREGDIRFIVCTSTLAQGVNLPIKYLIVTSIYQGSERLKVRDFHNLIGRAGRAGKHTEGSILFADPEIIDKRSTEGWRWDNIRELIDPSQSEACTSTLLSIFNPFTSDDSKKYIPLEFIDFLKAYFLDQAHLEKFPQQMLMYAEHNFTAEGIGQQIKEKMALVFSVQSFLMAHLDEDGGLSAETAVSLCEQTLAYYLADDNIKIKLKDLFAAIAEDLNQKAASPESRKTYSRTLLGLEKSKELEDWLKQNIQNLIASENDFGVLKVLWPIITEFITNKTFKGCNDFTKLLAATELWIEGRSFGEIYNHFQQAGIKRRWGTTQLREYSIDHIVEVFEQGLSYDGGLVIGAVSTLIQSFPADLLDDDTKEVLTEILYRLQKKIKYGLSTSEEISIYEAGFSDRVIATRISGILGAFIGNADTAKHLIRQRIEIISEALSDMPRYYRELLLAN